MLEDRLRSIFRVKNIPIEKFLRINQEKAPAPYEVPVFQGTLKLDANESPYEISTNNLTEIFHKLGKVHLNRYPDPSYSDLRHLLSQRWGYPPDQIVLGNGSDELIQAIIIAFGGLGKTVFTPTPSFVMYRIIAGILGEKLEDIPLTENFDLDLSNSLQNRIFDSTQPGNIIFLAIPNNPTGNCFSGTVVKEIVENFYGIVCIDEAYYDFAENNYINLLPEHPNLIILRTVSKIGLAGIRIGALLAGKSIIEAVRRVKLPYNINILSETVAQYVLSKKDDFESKIKQIKQNRDWLYKQMKQIEGIHVYPSQANFLLFRVSQQQDQIYTRLLEEKILIRNFGNQGRLGGHFRVTIGTQEEGHYFLKKLKKILSEVNS